MKQSRITALFLTLLLALPLMGSANASTLADLIQEGERKDALELIRNGADVNTPQPDGTTPLHWAVYQVDEELVDSLLSREADPNVSNNFGTTPLAEAMKSASVDIARLLLEAGADVEASNEDGQTPLMIAIDTGVYEMVEMLVEQGADVNAREKWKHQTPLMWAASGNHPDMVELFLDNGAEVNVRARVNDWPAQITSEPRAQYRPSGGMTPLLYAARSGCDSCVRDILEAGADINEPNPDGVTPLMVAIENTNYGLAEYMLEQGANPHVWDWWGRTALYVATDMASMNAPFGYGFGDRDEVIDYDDEEADMSAEDMMRVLLEAGVDPNPQLNMHRPGRGGNSGRFTDDLLTTGATPMLRAAVGQNAEAISVLLEYDADVNMPNVMGATPVMAAAGQGTSIRDRSGNFNAPNVQERAIEALEVLIEGGADVNARLQDVSSLTARIARRSTVTEREGQTALYGAVKWAWEDVVTFLVENGAEVDIEDDNDKSPVDAAKGDISGRDNEPSESIEAFLREHGGSEGSGEPAEPVS